MPIVPKKQATFNRFLNTYECPQPIHSLARFDVAHPHSNRPEGSGICLAQAEGLGIFGGTS